ncbi:putative UDP-glucuronosyl/UDP-glucosyltransferase [Dioscorea sansibarensis]
MCNSAESNSMTTFPSIQAIHFNVVPLAGPGDPFFLQFGAIRMSPHLLLPLLTSSSPPITCIIVDITLASTFLTVISPTGISALSFYSLPRHVEVPGVGVIPKASLPLPLHNLSGLFTTQFVANGRARVQAKGILINTFEALEPKTLIALNDGVVVHGLPPVIAVGPLNQLSLKETSAALPWVDAQPGRSVAYVSFGSRTGMSVEQIRELGVGLGRSGARFLWVIRMKKVDKEEAQVELEDLSGEQLAERIKEKESMVVHGWVEQEEILKHGAAGRFVSHSGWNSVTEAAMHGVIAEVVRRSGLGVWVEEWSWEDEGKVVKGEEISERVKELMDSLAVPSPAARVTGEAVKAVGEGGSSEKSLAEFIC